MQANPGPWLFFGDFNAVLGAHEKRGGCLPSRLSYEEFRAWSDTCNLTHVQTLGAEFTWSNNRSSGAHTELRLDRAICNDDQLNYWSHMTCCTLSRCCSDHFLLLLFLPNACKYYPSSFKFFFTWNSHKDYTRLVKVVWEKPVQGCPMDKLSRKLKLPKADLKFGIKLYLEMSTYRLKMLRKRLI